MTVSTRSSSSGTGAQSKSTKQGLSGISKKSKHNHGSSKPANETVRSGRKSGKRNVPSTDSDGEDADDELHPTDCSPPLKRRRKEVRPLAGRRRSKSKSNSIQQEGSECDSPATASASVPGKSRTNRQRVAPKRMPKRDNEASTKSGISTGSKTVRPHDPSGSTPAIAPDRLDELSSSLSELTTSDGSPFPLPAVPLPPAVPPLDEQLPSVPQKEDDNSIIPASEPESVVPASQADSAPLASQCSSIVPASVSGSSQIMDVSCTQEDAEVGVGGDELVPVTQPVTTQATTSAQQNSLTQEALESFSMEGSLPRSAMDTQTSGEAAGEQDRLSYVTDEDGHENVPPAQEDPPAFGLPLFHDGTDWQHVVPNDGFIPPAPVMKDLDVFSQSQPYSSQGGTQRDWTSSSQMSIVSSGGQVSPNRPTSFRYPLLPGSSSNDVAQRFPRFESPFAQNVGTSRAVPNTKRNFALGVDALQFDEPGQVPSLAFPPPFPPPQSSDPSVVEYPSDAEGEHEIVVPDDQHYQQL